MNITARLRQFLYNGPDINRRNLLLFALALGCMNTLVYFWLPSPGFDHNLNFLAFVIFLILISLVLFFDAVSLSAHALISLCFILLLAMVGQSGGINSPNIVWMPVLAVAALLLINFRWAVIWLVIILLHNLGQFLAVHFHWISGAVNPQNMPLDSALLIKLNILLFLMMALGIYDWMYRNKTQYMSERNLELEAMQTALIQAQNHKDEFIASVGHELRTPMNAILGLNDVLIDELADEPEQVRAARHIRDATNQLLRVVNDILDIAQLEAGRFHFTEESFLLADTLQLCLQKYIPKAHTKSLFLDANIQIAPDSWVRGDRQRLMQVLGHLLENAVKFTSQGGVYLRARKQGQVLRLEVEDTGIGVAPKDIDTIFSRFAHANKNTHRAFDGAGLGLALSNHLVSQAGGSIGVADKPAQGALFWLEWPMPATEAPHATKDPHDSASLKSWRFLIVDDHPMNQMVVQIMLRKRWPHCQVDIAENGLLALERLNHAPYDLVLMDLYMPGLDGFETTKQIREHVDLRIRSMAVIGLTANNVSGDIQRCLNLGMQSVVFKPIDQEKFFAVLERNMQSGVAHEII
jgi:signal transduction histidine kinase/CheY-like chemotaxis protein